MLAMLCMCFGACGQKMPALLEGWWIAVGWHEGEEVVHGKRVDLATVGAAVLDFGASEGL